MSLFDCVGKPKSAIICQLTQDYIEFLHWLYVPSVGVVLSFDKQICCGIDAL